ncbi:MAG: hypothetical protein A2Y12_00700 [Planctomycetes bacterium GWF2_42_9]|nr:MAG: hypothetical protein A2Y12_00700 [Planctomycetes bacterium GWF2_42_9]HAL45609.1 hypothetical protein [Phycisphaerales bacterium]
MMDKKEIYGSWVEKQIEIPDLFADKVMKQVSEYEHQPKWFDIPGIIEIISAHTIIKNCLITAGVAIGFIRVIYIMIVILSKGFLNG